MTQTDDRPALGDAEFGPPAGEALPALLVAAAACLTLCALIRAGIAAMARGSRRP